MVDSTHNAASPAEAPRELKSTDTSTVKPVLEAAKVEKTEPKETPKEVPVEVAAVVEDAEEAGSEDVDASSAEAPKSKRERLPRWVQERMERVRLQTERETRDRLLQEFQQTQAKPEPANVAAADKPKTLEDFDYDQDAFFDYKVEQGIQRREQQAKQQEAQRKEAESAEAFKAKIDTFESRVGAGAWEDIATSPLNADPAFKPLVDLFLGDDNDLDIAHHLATHLDDAKRINALPPLQRAREVAKLAEMFETPEAAEKPKPVPKKSTNAPPPPKTLSGAGKPSVDINSPDLSTADRIRLWRAKTG